MSRWRVVAGKKRGGPFETQELRRLADAGRIPPTAFIGSDEEAPDWQEFQTVEGLCDAPKPCVLRHCSECDARLYLTIESADESLRCPNCSAIGKPIDYLSRLSPPIHDVPIEPWGAYDVVILLMAISMVAVAAFGAFAIVFNPSLSALLGLIFFTAGAWLFAISFHHRSQTSRYRNHLRHVEQALEERSSLLTTADRELEGLRRGLVKVRNDIIQQAESELQEKRAEAQANLEISEYRRDAVHRIAAKFLEQAYEWWSSKMRGDNYAATKDRIVKAIEFCRKQGYDVPPSKQKEVYDELKYEYERVLRREHEKEEQRRIREQIREEQRIEREMKRRIEAAESEEKAIQRALDAALRRADAEHSAEVERLREELRLAQEKAERAKSQAQLTKAGHVYVISNIGSFGEDVYKVGLTRRLEPQDRVKELGDASVPFPFDVHMMISSEDAPNLEFTLHQALHRFRVNRVNFRKEFFRIDLDTIRCIVEQHHGVVEYVADPEAFEYHQSQGISDEDFDYLEKVAVFEGMEDEDDDLDGMDE